MELWLVDGLKPIPVNHKLEILGRFGYAQVSLAWRNFIALGYGQTRIPSTRGKK